MCNMKSDRRLFRMVLVYIFIICGLVALTTWLFVRQVPVPYDDEAPEPDLTKYFLPS